MPEIKVRKANGMLSTITVDEGFVEKMHDNWKSQREISGYKLDNIKDEKTCSKSNSREKVTKDTIEKAINKMRNTKPNGRAPDYGEELYRSVWEIKAAKETKR